MAASNRLVIDLGANQEPYEVSEEQTLGELVARTYVVGKIFSDRRVSPSQKYNQMRQIWYIKGEFRVIPSQQMCSLSASNWRRTASMFSKGFVRARIEFDVTQPLRPGVHVLDMAGHEIWIKFRYERLGEFCTRCGLISHAIYKCKQPKHLNKGKELPGENNFGPWMRAKEIYGKHYSGMKSFDTARPLASDSNMTPEDASNLDDSKAADTPIADQVGRSSTVKLGKRKAATDPTISPIHESSRKLHTDLMQAVAEIVEETDNYTLVHASASKPKWKRLARETIIIPTPSDDEWVEAYEHGECPSDGMGVVMPLPRGDPREPADPSAGYPLQ
ncbi:hypothetical protein Tsubulata_046952 [Turnera subulata]|uniref:Zinc knuckle CX2CX4HX4C domain-containing protein n=1 Tax=Turnera subulata TaxID=218843 RepID=A0A9Q0FLF1_9ROSI|nr:hypothetical protein Tsubulata_046952 [Turnera subulata]